jgi:hypothetical protein
MSQIWDILPVTLAGILLSFLFALLFLRLLVKHSSKVIVIGYMCIAFYFFAQALVLFYLSMTCTDTADNCAGGYQAGAISTLFFLLVGVLTAYCRRYSFKMSLAMIDVAVHFVDQTKSITTIPVVFFFVGLIKHIFFWSVIVLICFLPQATTSGYGGYEYLDQSKLGPDGWDYQPT